VGAHAPVAGGLADGALAYAAAVGAEAIQVFVSNPRGWAPGPGDPAQEAALAGHIARTGLPVFVHAPYLVNVGSPDPALRERCAAALRLALRRGTAIGARGVVVHAGSAIDGDRAGGLARAAALLLPLALVHANDSRDGCGSRHDRHESIGKGQAGLAAFAGLLRHPATAGVPFVVETPGGKQGHAADVAALRGLRDAPAGSGAGPGLAG
jgi:deoxyribonuclease-4